MESISELFLIFRDIIAYAIAGAILAWYFYYYKRRDLLGGFWGGFVIGTIGAVLLDFALSTFFIDVVNWLMKPRIGNDQYVTRINLIAAFIGAAIFVYILNHINHDRERRR